LTVDAANLLYGRERGKQTLDVPVWCGVIETDRTRILVDTGIRDPGWVAANNLGSCKQGEEDTIVGALQRIGLSCNDIDMVINTHLHFDHCANNYLFPRAKLFVAKKEWEAAFDPIPEQAILYSAREWLLEPLQAADYTLVDEDDLDLVPGVRIIRTPGHTPGHQVVMADTAEGTVCIAGDSVNVNESFVQRRPGGIVWDLDLAISSLDKIRQRSDRILMAHDVRIDDFMKGGYPVIPGPEAKVAGCC
jgi:glyoxylase-like metal-dependent hydrolase (beta-lactamase superfamily II)